MEWIKWFILFSPLVTLSRQTINYRLPQESIPNHYDLRIEPHIVPGRFTFEGQVEISLTIVQPTRYITLHWDNLNIDQDSTTLLYKTVYLSPKQHIFQEIRQFLILHFEHLLQRGNYTLYLKYSANLDVGNRGFFRTTYFNDNNEIQSLVATHFEPTFARRAFPCWDEPALKATFKIRIKHFPKYTALSNMPVEKVVNDTKIDGKIWTVFQTTPLMSTYLVAFAVTDFGNITNLRHNVSVWARKNALDSVAIGFKYILKAIPILESYTGIPYALPKLDVLVVPGYSIDAMENWGLILIGETVMLRNSSSMLTDKIRTAQVVAHEMSHQWFGNLVSPEWWSDLWITEGITTYLQYFLASEILNDPKIKDLFVVENNYQEFDSTDSGISNNPLVSIKDDSRSLDKHLHTIHKKAAGMIYMISGLTPRYLFQIVLRNLLKTKFKTINTERFLSSIKEAMDEEKLPQSNFDLMSVMNRYIHQTGYLVINVTRDYATGTIRLKKSCVFCESNQPKNFWVPINFATSRYSIFSYTIANYWMHPFKDELIIDDVNPDDWVILNIESIGFYRVIYDEENWRRIINYLNSKHYHKIHVLNRATLLEDALWARKYHGLNSDLLINLTSYLLHEKEYVPWVSGFKILDFLKLFRHSSESTRTFLEQFIRDLYQSLYTNIEIDLHGNLLSRSKFEVTAKWIENNFDVTQMRL